MGRHSWTRTGGGAHAAPGHGGGASAVACIRRSVTQPGEGSAAASLCSEEQINGRGRGLPCREMSRLTTATEVAVTGR